MSAVLQFTVDKEMKKEKDKRRRQQRKRMGFTTKRRKLMKPESVQLESEAAWLRYLRFMFIAGYKMVRARYKDTGEVLDVIEEWCPADVSEEALVSEKDGKDVLEDYDLGPICELLTSYKDRVIEPAVVVRASQLLERLRSYFPVSREALKDTPYDNQCEFNIVSGEDMARLADSFKLAAKHRHVGAELTSVQETDSTEPEPETET